MQLEKIKRKIKEGYTNEEIHSMSGVTISFIEGLRDPEVNVKKHKWHSRQNNA
jgi:hypothetical protein